MRNLFCALLAFLACGYLPAACPLVFTAQAVDSGMMGKRQTVLVVAELRNRTQSDVTVCMMTEGWYDSLVIMPAPRFVIFGEICTANFPEDYVLHPGGGYLFVFPVSTLGVDEKIVGEEFSVGFCLKPENLRKDGDQPEVIWSAPIKISGVNSKAVTNSCLRFRLRPNQTLLPTTTAGTPAAGQPPRQP